MSKRNPHLHKIISPISSFSPSLEVRGVLKSNTPKVKGFRFQLTKFIPHPIKVKDFRFQITNYTPPHPQITTTEREFLIDKFCNYRI